MHWTDELSAMIERGLARDDARRRGMAVALGLAGKVNYLTLRRRDTAGEDIMGRVVRDGPGMAWRWTTKGTVVPMNETPPTGDADA